MLGFWMGKFLNNPDLAHVIHDMHFNVGFPISLCTGDTQIPKKWIWQNDTLEPKIKRFAYLLSIFCFVCKMGRHSGEYTSV